MKVYTKTGDKGTSTLYSGERVTKADRIFNVLGELDRLNCDLGLVRSYASQEYVRGIKPIQELLIRIGSCIGTRPSNRVRYEKTRVTTLPADTSALEQQIDSWSEFLKPLTTFLTPGDSEHSARVHKARTTCRSLERTIVGLCDDIKREIADIQKDMDDIRELSQNEDAEHIEKVIQDTEETYEDTKTLLHDLEEVAQYINRLSDYLFVLARYIEEVINTSEWFSYLMSL